MGGNRHSQHLDKKQDPSCTYGLTENLSILSVVGNHDPCLRCLSEDLLSKLACSSSLDGIEVRIDSVVASMLQHQQGRLEHSNVETHSSAPSIVTSNAGC